MGMGLELLHVEFREAGKGADLGAQELEIIEEGFIFLP